MIAYIIPTFSYLDFITVIVCNYVYIAMHAFDNFVAVKILESAKMASACGGFCVCSSIC